MNIINIAHNVMAVLEVILIMPDKLLTSDKLMSNSLFSYYYIYTDILYIFFF